MFQFRSAFSAENYCNNIETKGTIFNIIGGEEITGGPRQLCLLCGSNRRLGRSEGLVGYCPYLDEDQSTIGVNHNEVDFAGFAGEIAGERFKAFSFEETLGAFFTPSAEAFLVG
jgi:hypothetical protein